MKNINLTTFKRRLISNDMEYILRYHVPEVNVDIHIDAGNDIQRKHYQVYWNFKYEEYDYSVSESRFGFFSRGIFKNISYTVQHLGEYVGYPKDEE